LVAARNKLKLEFVENWQFDSEFEALLRTRLPLNREPPKTTESVEGGENGTKNTEGEEKKDTEEKKVAETKNTEEKAPE